VLLGITVLLNHSKRKICRCITSSINMPDVISSITFLWSKQQTGIMTMKWRGPSICWLSRHNPTSYLSISFISPPNFINVLCSHFYFHQYLIFIWTKNWDRKVLLILWGAMENKEQHVSPGETDLSSNPGSVSYWPLVLTWQLHSEAVSSNAQQTHMYVKGCRAD
jgi:hypothetical protein